MIYNLHPRTPISHCQSPPTTSITANCSSESGECCHTVQHFIILQFTNDYSVYHSLLFSTDFHATLYHVRIQTSSENSPRDAKSNIQLSSQKRCDIYVCILSPVNSRVILRLNLLVIHQNISGFIQYWKSFTVWFQSDKSEIYRVHCLNGLIISFVCTHTYEINLTS